VLTYTVDEILDYASDSFKDGAKSVFDLQYSPLPHIEKSFDDIVLLEAREKFYEAIDKLKKEKLIKSTLELEIVGDRDIFEIKSIKDLEDWFVVSAIKESSNGDEVASFTINDKTFKVHKATDYKCPRCWKFTTKEEDCACDRCIEVVG